MSENIAREGARHVSDMRAVSRHLTEKALKMRCLAYLSNVKAELLTQTLYSMKRSKSALRQEITRRVEVERQFRNSQDLYRQMFSANRAVKLLVDPSTGDIIDANDAAGKFYGYAVEELRAMSIFDINTMNRMDLLKEMSLAEEELCTYFRFKHRLASGEVRDVEVYTGPVNVGGKKYLHSIIHDLTDRLRAEETLRNLAAGFGSVTGEEFFHKLVTHLAKSTRMDFACIGELAVDRPGTVNVVAMYDRGQFVSFRYELDGAPCEQVVGQNVVSVPSGARRLYPHSQFLQEKEVEAYIGAPLFDSTGKPLGLMTLMSAEPVSNPELAESTLLIFADRVSAELERKQAQEKLARGMESLTKAQQIAHVGSWDWNIAANTLEWSDEIYRMFGLQPREFKATYEAFVAHVHPDDRAKVNEAVRAALEDNAPYKVEHRIILPDGTERVVMEQGEVVRGGSGKPVKMVGSVHDITERTRYQQRLEWLLSVQTATLEATADGILVVDHHGKMVSHNQKFLEMWHIPRALAQEGNDAEIRTLCLAQLKDPKAFVTRHRELHSDAEATSFDLVEFTDGRVFERVSTPQRLEGAAVGRVLSFRDVTARKEVEDLLHETLSEFNAILESAEVGVIFLKTRTVRWVNRKMLELFGYRRDEVEGDSVTIFHPSERDFLAFRDVAFPALSRGETFHDERLMRKKDGSLFWCRLLGKAIDPAAIGKGSIWITEDVSARKKAEEELRLSAAVFENTMEGILITDAGGVVRFVNPAFTRVTGYEPEEIVGRAPSLLKSGRQDGAFYEAMWRELMETGHWQGEIWNRRKNGEIYAELLSITAIRNERGDVTHFAGVFNDITDRKKQEELVNYLAYHDPLTGLPNRQLFYDRLEIELARARREKRQLAVMFMDLDHFKEINDSLGHDVGDELLKEVARRVRECVRESDSISRLGGDEFTLLAPDIHAAEDAVLVARKIMESLREPFHIRAQRFMITSSVGMSLFPLHGETPEALIKKADDAMYYAKRMGRDNFQVYGEG